jgi:hypothetical protein
MTDSRARDVEAVAEGLWLRLRDAALAEERLRAFAFSPEAPAAAGPGDPVALAQDRAAAHDLARDFTLRALAAMADPENFRILRAAREGASIAAVARAVGLSELAVTERVHALAQVALAARDVERNRLEPTAAGRGLVRLVEALTEGVRERLARGLPALPSS